MNLFELFAKISVDTNGYESKLTSASKKFNTFSSNVSSATIKNAQFNDGLGKAGDAAEDAGEYIEETGDEIEEMGEKSSSSKNKISKFVSELKKIGSTASEVVKKIENLGEKTIKVFSGIAAATSTAFIAFGKDALESYADYEQLVGGVETLFEYGAGNVKKYADNAYKTAGMSANAYMETVTSFAASLIQSLDGDTQKAADYADMAITDMSDNANKLGTEISLIQNAYQGFAKANYTMLDNLKLGYGGTQSEMKRLLSDAEKISGIEYDISSFADIVDAIHVIQTEMGITGTTAKEAASTISGSVSSMKASWQNLLTGFAGGGKRNLDDLISDFVTSVVTVGKNVVPVVKTIAKNIKKVISEYFSQASDLIVTALLNITKSAPLLIGEVSTIIKQIVYSIGEHSQELGDAAKSLFGSLFSGFKSVLNTVLPVVSEFIPTAISIFLSYKNLVFETGLKIISALVDGLIGNEEEISNGLFEIINLFVTFFNENSDKIILLAQNLIVALCNGLTQNLGGILEAVSTILFALLNGFSAVLPTVLPTLLNVFMSIVDLLTSPDFLNNVIGAAGQILISLAQGLINSIPIIVKAIPTILGNLINALSKGATQILGVGVTLLETLLYGLLEALPEIAETIPTILETIVNTVVENAPQMITAAAEIILSFINGLISNLPQILQSATQIVSSLVISLIEMAPQLLKAALQLIMSLASGLIDFAIELLKVGPDLVKAIFDGLLNAGKTLLNAGKTLINTIKEGFNLDSVKTWGKDLIDNFVSGIKEKWNKLTSTVKDVAQTVKDYLGFSEPEKGPLSNFHTYAPDMMDLFAKGIKDNEDVVTNQIKKSFDFGNQTISSGFLISSVKSPSDAKYSVARTNDSINMGGVTININGANYTDEESLAEEIANVLQNMIDRKDAAYA